MTTIIQNIPMPTCFADLSNYLTTLLEDSSLSMTDLRQLHHTLEEAWEKTVMDASHDGHPYWSICTGKTACQLYLYRPWKPRRGREQNLEQIRLILEHLQSEFVPADGPQITPHSAERLLRLLDKDCNFSRKVLAPEPMLLFLPDCGHRTYDAFCVPYLLDNDAVTCDIFLPRILRDKHSTPESMLLHELGHVLNVRLTGDLMLAPPAFLEFGEPFFPGLSDRHRSVSGELFAHCFAMGVFSRHPELRELDPFTMVTAEDKQAFGRFMEALIRTLPE